MDKFRNLFRNISGNVIGMVHAKAMPGTPRSRLTVKEIRNVACEEAEVYKDADVDGIIVENMHDIPYLHTDNVGPEITAAMSLVCSEVKKVFGGPVGVQILAGANKQALAVAQAAGLDFIRAEGFIFSHIADEGLMDACAGDLLRYRRSIGADSIHIFTDVKKKHSSHALTSDVDIVEMSRAAQFFLSDGVILTGSATGQPASVAELQEVMKNIDIPVLIGSGVTEDNILDFMKANALIVGSHFKTQGSWCGQLDAEKVKSFMECVRKRQ